MAHSVVGWNLTRKGSRYLKTDKLMGPKGTVRYYVLLGLEAINILKREVEQRILTGGYLSSCESRGYLPDIALKKVRRSARVC